MDKLKAVLTRREDPEANNITEDDRGFISETLDASTLSYRSFKIYVDKNLDLFSLFWGSRVSVTLKAQRISWVSYRPTNLVTLKHLVPYIVLIENCNHLASSYI